MKALKEALFLWHFDVPDSRALAHGVSNSMGAFSIDMRKAANAVLFVASAIPEVRFHKLLKIIYFADLKHLAMYGRPITGDRYVAMKDGPVASWIYDLLKRNRGKEWWDTFEVTWLMKNVMPKTVPDLDCFSDSDIECLQESITENKGLGFGELARKSHGYAWQATRRHGEISLANIEKQLGLSEPMIKYIEQRIGDDSFKPSLEKEKVDG
jgi:uncharacterized phage-associated protein